MVLLLHICIAVSSLIYTAAIFFAPSRAKLRVSYALVGLTLASGGYLIASQPAQLTHACLSGLVYLGIIFAAILAVRSRISSITPTA